MMDFLVLLSCITCLLAAFTCAVLLHVCNNAHTHRQAVHRHRHSAGWLGCSFCLCTTFNSIHNIQKTTYDYNVYFDRASSSSQQPAVQEAIPHIIAYRRIHFNIAIATAAAATHICNTHTHTKSLNTKSRK